MNNLPQDAVMLQLDAYLAQVTEEKHRKRALAASRQPNGASSMIGASAHTAPRAASPVPAEYYVGYRCRLPAQLPSPEPKLILKRSVRAASWPTSAATTSPMSPTQPNAASTESAPASNSHGPPSPTPA
ncbi:hypothetical protein ACFUVV_12185 [Streptomyces sp. NPDC057376]|uniref:hypothetical protein n=1 Tax=unclassified Streptomyces TaxID=2593676 RepID=UPI00116136C3|nr:hypothetical protein [Streptomyces sp. CB02414]